MAKIAEKVYENLADLLQSKKFKVYLGAVAAILAADKEPGLFVMSVFTIEALVTATLGYMGAQGIADHGKEKIKAEAKASKEAHASD